MLKKIFNFTFFIFLGVVVLTILLPTNAFSELLSHFMRIYFFISLIYGVIYLSHPNKKFMALALCASVLTAFPPLCSLDSERIKYKEPAPVEDISILQCNIQYKNKGHFLLCQRIGEQGYPDIVVVQEVTPEILETLTYLLKEWYPHRFEAPESGAYGVAVFSKFPMIKAQRKAFQKSPNKYTLLQFVTAREKVPFTLIELHATSPSRDLFTNQRKQELEELPTIISQTPNEHKILAGDLNTTPYSPYFQKLKKSLNFKNAMGGFTFQENSVLDKLLEAWEGFDAVVNCQFQGTWPSAAPFFLRIPIDHVLTSKTMRVISRSVLAYVGSDHLPVLTRIRLYEKGADVPF